VLRIAEAIALLLAMLPPLFGRKGLGNSEVFEPLLTRVNLLRLRASSRCATGPSAQSKRAKGWIRSRSSEINCRREICC
jgi:hypothetical protein